MSPKHFEAVQVPSMESLSASDRAVIEFTGLDMAGSSYEGRVFLNNTSAGPGTPKTPEEGYAGSFHMYAMGTLPDGTPIGLPPSEGPGMAPGKARIPMQRYIVATEAVRRAAASGPMATVTIVPVHPGAVPPANPAPSPEAESPLIAESVAIRAENAG